MEIEVKATVQNIAELQKKFEGLGCVFSEAVTQDDTVYVRTMGSLEEFLSNDVYLRIRIQNDGRVLFTAKRPKSKNGLVKIEHEVSVDSADELRNILSIAGFVEGPRVIKRRRTAHYEKYEICLDEIENLGAFVELEQIGESEQADEIQRNMFVFLESLGIPRDGAVQKGYDILLIEKQASA